MTPVSIADRSKFSPERRAHERRVREEGERAAAAAARDAAFDRVAHLALASRRKAEARIRNLRGALEAAEAEVVRAEEELAEVFVGSGCLCDVCRAEVTERLRAEGTLPKEWRRSRPPVEAVVAAIERSVGRIVVDRFPDGRVVERRALDPAEGERLARALGFTLDARS
jgi:hypothetical protein